MPLTVRTNGSGGSNIITASWWNDYYNLLTGTMTDQEVSIQNLMILKSIGAAPTAAASGTAVSGSGLNIGVYTYAYTYANVDGETLISPTNNVTTSTGNQKVNLTGITVGPTGTTKRNLYRSAVGGGATGLKFLATISDNVTTTFSDVTADGSLGVVPPAHPSFGGSLLLRDSSGITQLQGFSDGSLAANGIFQSNVAGTVVNGTAGTATFYTPVWGTALKILTVVLNGYTNTGVGTFTLPSPMTQCRWWSANLGSSMTFGLFSGGSAQNVAVLGTIGSSSSNGTDANTTTPHGNNQGEMISSWNQIQLGTISSPTITGMFVFMGV